MKYRVECAIKTVNTDISCEIEICEVSKKKEVFVMDWNKIGGRLDIGKDEGRWFYLRIKGETKGIVLFPHKEGEESNRAYTETDKLVTLNDVPDSFIQSVGCGTEYSGEGTLHRTNERVFWRIYYSCV